MFDAVDSENEEASERGSGEDVGIGIVAGDVGREADVILYSLVMQVRCRFHCPIQSDMKREKDVHSDEFD